VDYGFVRVSKLLVIICDIQAEVIVQNGDEGRAFELSIKVLEPHRPFGLVEYLPAIENPDNDQQQSWRKQPALLVNFFPKLDHFHEVKGEIIFIVDRFVGYQRHLTSENISPDTAYS